jgi:hypothetical protein
MKIQQSQENKYKMNENIRAALIYAWTNNSATRTRSREREND